jgi:hypothetical protein
MPATEPAAKEATVLEPTAAPRPPDWAKLFERAADARRLAKLLRQESQDLGAVGLRRRLAARADRRDPAHAAEV